MHLQRECGVGKWRVASLGRHDLNYSYTQMGSELIVTFQQKRLRHQCGQLNEDVSSVCHSGQTQKISCN